MAFDGNRIATRKLAASLASQLEASALAGERRHNLLEQKRRQTPEYYVTHNSCGLLGSAVAVFFSALILLWVSVCLDREIASRLQDNNNLLANAGNPSAMRDPNIRAGVMNAEERLRTNPMMAVLCRVLNDSFIMQLPGAYESSFRRAIDSALQQHWFAALLCITVVICFFASITCLVYFSCTRRLWYGGGKETLKQA